MNNIPKVATAAEVQAFIVHIGGIVPFRGLCPSYNGDYEGPEDEPLVVPDDCEDDGCPYYDGSREADTWYASRARDGRVEARCDRGER